MRVKTTMYIDETVASMSDKRAAEHNFTKSRIIFSQRKNNQPVSSAVGYACPFEYLGENFVNRGIFDIQRDDRRKIHDGSAVGKDVTACLFYAVEHLFHAHILHRKADSL